MILAWLCWVGRSQEAEPRGLISLQQVSQIKVTSEDAAEYAAIITTVGPHHDAAVNAHHHHLVAMAHAHRNLIIELVIANRSVRLRADHQHEAHQWVFAMQLVTAGEIRSFQDLLDLQVRRQQIPRERA